MYLLVLTYTVSIGPDLHLFYWSRLTFVSIGPDLLLFLLVQTYSCFNWSRLTLVSIGLDLLLFEDISELAGLGLLQAGARLVAAASCTDLSLLVLALHTQLNHGMKQGP